MVRLELLTPVLISFAFVAACDRPKESRPADSGSKPTAAASADKGASARPVKADLAKPADAKRTEAKPTEPPKEQAPKAEPCLVTVSVDDGSAKTKPIEVTTVTPMAAMDDAARTVVGAAIDGKPIALAPLTREEVLTLGRALRTSGTTLSIEFADYDSATYSFDAAGRMTKVEFDPTAETRYAIFEYHYECDEALLAGAKASDAGTTAPPDGIPAHWKAVEGDPTGMESSGTFFVPEVWAVEGKVPHQEARPSADSGVHCYLNMPRELKGGDAKAQLLKMAKADAKKYAATDATVEHHGIELYVLEYAAQGDGTLVVEAWNLDDTVPSGVTCADESGERFKDDRKDVDLVVRSFLPFTGERG